MAVIYFPGSWDIPHIGHVNALNNAGYDYNNGDELIVGVEADRICGKRIPIFDERERLKLISSLSCVSRAFIYYTHDYKLHCDCDIFACGPDFGGRDDQKEHLDWCVENEIEIIRVPRTDGISTSEIIRRIKKI